MASRLSCDFADRVSLKHKYKMTGDGCILKILRCGVDGNRLMRLFFFFHPSGVVHGVDVRLSASLTERICSAFSKGVGDLHCGLRRGDLTRTTFLPLTLIGQKNGQSAGRNSKISRTG